METGVAFGEAFDPFRAVRTGWAAVKRFWPVLLVGGCLKACTEGGGGANGGQSFQDTDPSGMATRAEQVIQAIGLGVIAVIVLVVMAVVLCLRAWIVPGWIRVHRTILAEGRADFETLFGALDRFLPMLAWEVVRFLVLTATLILAAAPGIGIALAGQPVAGVVVGVLLALPVGVYVGLGLSFGAHAVALEERGATDALARSWELAAGHRLPLFWFRLVLVAVEIGATVAGLCLLCIGVLLTRPLGLALVDVGFTEAFLLHTRPRSETGAWRGPEGTPAPA